MGIRDRTGQLGSFFHHFSSFSIVFRALTTGQLSAVKQATEWNGKPSAWPKTQKGGGLDYLGVWVHGGGKRGIRGAGSPPAAGARLNGQESPGLCRTQVASYNCLSLTARATTVCSR